MDLNVTKIILSGPLPDEDEGTQSAVEHGKKHAYTVDLTMNAGDEKTYLVFANNPREALDRFLRVVDRGNDGSFRGIGV